MCDPAIIMSRPVGATADVVDLKTTFILHIVNGTIFFSIQTANYHLGVTESLQCLEGKTFRKS